MVDIEATLQTDPEAKNILKTFFEAVNMLDESENEIRCLLENELMDVAGVETNLSKSMLAGAAVAKKISVIREAHIKRAFRHLRDNLPLEDEDETDPLPEIPAEHEDDG